MRRVGGELQRLLFVCSLNFPLFCSPRAAGHVRDGAGVHRRSQLTAVFDRKTGPNFGPVSVRKVATPVHSLYQQGNTAIKMLGQCACAQG
jgi:hypothetical protein